MRKIIHVTYHIYSEIIEHRCSKLWIKKHRTQYLSKLAGLVSYSFEFIVMIFITLHVLRFWQTIGILVAKKCQSASVCVDGGSAVFQETIGKIKKKINSQYPKPSPAEFCFVLSFTVSCFLQVLFSLLHLSRFWCQRYLLSDGYRKGLILGKSGQRMKPTICFHIRLGVVLGLLPITLQVVIFYDTQRKICIPVYIMSLF